MPRTRAPGRQTEIVDAAVRLFMRRGYTATRMETIAEEAGVAPGTLYLYAEGKEALFNLALHAAFHGPVPDPDSAPHRLQDRESVIESTWRMVEERAHFPRLERAANLPEVDEAGVEFEEVVVELYDWLARYWRGVRIVEKCAIEWPELSMFFYRELRRGGLDLLERYLEGRARQGLLRTMPDASAAARLVLETVSFFAMHRHTAPDSAGLGDEESRATVLVALEGAFVPA